MKRPRAARSVEVLLSTIQAAVKGRLSSSRTAPTPAPQALPARAGRFDNSGRLRAQGVLNTPYGSGWSAAVPALGTLSAETETMNRPVKLLPVERRVASGGNRSLAQSEQGLIREFIRPEGPFSSYVSTTESSLIVMDDAPTGILGWRVCVPSLSFKRVIMKPGMNSMFPGYRSHFRQYQ
jgi:hypothetical protein